MKKTNPLSTNDIVMYANNFRKRHGVALDAAFPIFDVIEKYHNDGILTLQILENGDSLFGVNEVAKYNPVDNFIYIKESVLEDLENKDYRSKFTLAHELFHFIQCRVLDFEFEDGLEGEKIPAYRDPEWQANEFAGQLLIPGIFIDDNSNFELLSKQFEVTEHCALTRILKYKDREKRKEEKKTC